MAPQSSAQGASRPTSVKHIVQQPLIESLLPWLEVFESCSTKWTLVADAREDGTTYKRHGVLVELTADITSAIGASEDTRFEKLRRIRQAIDLVQLTLAVDPHELMPLLLRRKIAVPNLSKNPGLDEEDLSELTQGDAPFELRLRLKIESKEADEIEDSLTERFMRKLDDELIGSVTGSPSALRRYLAERAGSSVAARRLMHCPIQTVLKLLP